MTIDEAVLELNRLRDFMLIKYPTSRQLTRAVEAINTVLRELSEEKNDA